MLGKLLKYDLKWTYKVLVVFYGLTLFFALLGRGFSLIDTSVFEFLSAFSCGTSVTFMFNILINNVMRLWARFVSNIYKDESYLTHTLPVTKNDIYFSKVICTIVTFITSFIVILLSFYICYAGSDLVSWLKGFITDSLWSVLGLIILVLVLEILFIQMVGYLGIIIGYSFNELKTVKSLIFGFCIYMASSVVSLICMVIYGLFDSRVMDLFTSNNTIPEISLFKSILIFASILYLTYIVVCNIISMKLIKRGVNVD